MFGPKIYYVQQWIRYEKHWFDNIVAQAIQKKGGEAILKDHLSVTMVHLSI